MYHVGQEATGADGVASLDHEAVRETNQAFYDAFEAKDFPGLIKLWEQSSRAQCTHPGWSILRGWEEVGASWAALIESPQQVQFVLTNEHIEVQGDIAWVTIDENILDAGGSGTVSATNMFVRSSDGWKMISHHGSSVMQGQ